MQPRLENASPTDVPAIAAIEATPAYAGRIGVWPAERHAEEMVTPGTRYLVWRGDGGVMGYAIVQRLDSPDRAAHLKRFAVKQAGTGVGPVFLRALLAWVFETTETNRLELDLFLDNERAQRLYHGAGFVEEGVLRDAFRTPDGTYRSLRVMSILRRNWRSRRGL